MNNKAKRGMADYRIKGEGPLGSQWSDWFENVTIDTRDPVTTLTSDVSDQSVLHGLIAECETWV